MTLHFIERCKHCDRVTAHCRCISEHKIVRYTVCDRCKETLDKAMKTPVTRGVVH